MAAIIYRILLVGVAGYGLADGFGLLAGQPAFYQFAYFTDVSNVLGFLYFFAAVAYGIRNARRAERPPVFLPRAKGAVTFSLAITLLVNHFVLGGTPFLVTEGHFDVANLLAHYLVPSMVILDRVLFDPQGAMRPLDPLLYALIPLAYFAYLVLRAQLGGPLVDGQYYPYPFLDLSVLGVAAVARNLVLGSLVFFALAYAVFAADHFLGRRERKQVML